MKNCNASTSTIRTTASKTKLPASVFYGGLRGQPAPKPEPKLEPKPKIHLPSGTFH